MIKKLYPVIFISVLFSLSCSRSTEINETLEKHSDTLVEGNALDVGISVERLSRIDEIVQKNITEENIPGAVVLVARNGKIVHHKAYGIADAETGRNYKKDDIFRIASQTKAITATAVMMLWEEGKLNLDQPVSDFIPSFKTAAILESIDESDSSFTTKPADKQITIRHLLTHTSGIGYGEIDADHRMKKIYSKEGIVIAFSTEDISAQENVEKLATLPLHHNPGDRWTYGMGLDVLVSVVEIISEQPFNEFLRERIFEPLQMDDTWFYLPEDKIDRLVPIIQKEEGKWKNFKADFYNPDYPITGARKLYSGGAGLSSTVLDYAKFLQMYLNGGSYNGYQLLSPTTIETIMANQIGSLWTGDRHYGLVFGVTNEKAISRGGQGSEGTFEWGGYFNTSYFADPELDIIGIVYKQTRGIGDPLSNQFRRAVFAAVTEE